MKILVSLGPISNHLFLVMSGIGGVVGSYFFFKELKKRGMDSKPFISFIVLSVIVGVLGSLAMFFVQSGEFAFFGGLLISLLVGYFYLKKKHMAPWETLDIVAPFLILALGISRIGSEVHGVAISSDSLWTLKLDGETFHPSQAYEFLLSYLLFGYLWLRLKSKEYHGQVILNFLVGLFFIKAVVQFSLNFEKVFGMVTSSQIILVIGMLLTIVFSKYRKKKSPLKSKSVERYEIAKTWFYLWVLMFLSLIVYYLIQA